MNVETVRRCLAVLEVELDLRPRWRGAALDRLLDERHARLEAAWKERLERWGWLVRVEASYSRYGERGRIDLLALHASRRILLVIEVKTEIVDAQSLLGGMDAKLRLAAHVAREAGWAVPSRVVPALIVAGDSANRRRVARVAALFAHLDTRGRSAVSWLRRPTDAPGGLLIFSDLSPANQGRVTQVGSTRVRLRGTSVSVDGRAEGAGGGRPAG